MMNTMMKMNKTLFDISWQVTEEQYREDAALSYSTLAKYERGGFEIIPKLFDKVESPSLTFGSAVDAIITGGEEEFNNRFIVADIPELSDTMLKIANKLYEKYSALYENIDKIPSESIKTVTDEFDYGKTWKVDTVANKVREACGDYYNLKFLAGDRTILSTAVNNDVQNSVRALKESKATRWIFQNDDPFDNVRRYYQLKFKSTLNGVDYRCMMDCVIVDYDNKIIYPYDLKTSSHKEYDFHKSFIDWSYQIQAKLYWRILRDNLDKDDYFKDFKLADYRFVVVNKITLNPLVWHFSATQSKDTIVLGKNKTIVMRDPEIIGKELHTYLTENSIVPANINIERDNDIVEWIEKEY